MVQTLSAAPPNLLMMTGDVSLDGVDAEADLAFAWAPRAEAYPHSALLATGEPVMTGIQLGGIRKAFGASVVLKGISIKMRAGEFLSLVGPSGCGKTTLLCIIAGLQSADAGRIAISGREMTTPRSSPGSPRPKPPD